jgi:dihydroorotate dehydrogenase (fumarate)
MNISTNYLGLQLKSPLVASPSPLMESLDNIKQLEDAGASAIVLHSLYEEQIQQERAALNFYMEYGTESYAEALSFFPEAKAVYTKTDDYLEHVRRATESVDIPVIASLNGTSLGGWTSFAEKMQEAGASAVELNIYHIPSDVNQDGSEVEHMVIDIVRATRDAIDIPIAVKLSPYYSNLANMAQRITIAGAQGLVLFNRFYQPDINLETLSPEPNLLLSTSYDLRLPLRWIGILYGRVQVDFAATSGIHSAEDAIKVIMAGANVAMMTSSVLKQGIQHFEVVTQDLIQWLVENECDSLDQIRGSISQKHSADPSAFERAQYMRGLKTYFPR